MSLHPHQGQVLGDRADRLNGHEQVKELVYGRCCHLESQHFQEKVLHADQLLLSVGAVCCVHKLIQLRREDLLVFPTRTQIRRHQALGANQ